MKKIALVFLCLVSVTAHAENVVVTQAKKAGVKHCLPAVEKLSNFIIGNGSAGVHSLWSMKKTDKSAFSAMIERDYNDNVIVTNLNVTPLRSGQCYAEYEKIIPLNKSCIAVSQEMKEAKYVGQINGKVSVMKQKSVNVYLIPSRDGCVMVRKEVIMDALKLK